MLRFLLRRLLVAIPTLFLVVTVAFFMMRAAPGSPFDMDRKLAPEVEANVMAKYGMDRPLTEQYVNYLGDAIRGDFGPSLKYKDKTVLNVLQENYAVSLKLGLSAIILAAIVNSQGPVLAFCRTGTRCINTWSIGERLAGGDRDELLRIGSAAGYDLTQVLPG